MTFNLLDCVVLTREIPEEGLCKGDVGTIVEVYPRDGIEVEFVLESGDTAAVLSLETSDVRPIANNDLPTVRTMDRTA